MAKKRKPKASDGKQWEWEEHASLLAWLDVSLKHKDVDFDTTVVNRFGGAFTLEQIERQLKRLWTHFGQETSKNWHDIKIHGSLLLHAPHHGLNEDEKRDIALAFEEFEKPFLLENSTPNRRLRSSSRADTTSSTQDSRFNTPIVETNGKAQGQKRKFGTDSLTPSDVKHKIVQVVISSPKSIKSRKRPKTYSKRDRARSIRAAACSPEARPPIREQRPSLPARVGRSSIIINDSDDGISDTLDGPPDGFDSSRESSIREQRPSLPARERRSSILIKDSDGDISDTLEGPPNGFNSSRESSVQERRLSLPARERRTSTPANESDGGISGILEGPAHVSNSSRESSIPFGPLGTDSTTSLSPDNTNDTGDERRIRCTCGVNEAVDGDENELIECNQCKVSQHTECVKYVCQECTEAQDTVAGLPTHYSAPQVDSSTDTGDRVDPTLHSAIIKIQELQESLANKERELQERRQDVEDLNQRIRYLNEAKEKRDKQHGSSIEEWMVQKQIQLHRLDNDLKARHRLGTFTKLSPESRYQGAKTNIKTGFVEAYHNIDLIFRQLDMKGFPCIPQLQMHKRLLGLAQRVAGSNPDSVSQSQERELLSIDPVVLLRSLAGAALQDWVFEADFPNFANDSSITLAAYRELLAIQDGALALRNLDLAAFEAKVGMPEFQADIVPKEARRLAIQLSHTVAPFFSYHPGNRDELSWDEFVTWGDAMNTWKDRQELLVKMFTDVLMIKANSCLNIEDYEMVTYPPGTYFDSVTMEAERMDGTIETSDCEGRLVRISVQAAIFVHARDPVLNNASVPESIIPTRNFVRRNESERKEAIPCLKAVVVLADMD